MKFINLPNYQKEDITKEIVKDFLNALTKDGKTIEVRWEGGNDEGEVYVVIDHEQIYYQYLDSPYYKPEHNPNDVLVSNAEQLIVNYIIDEICEILDYGSWAGNFNSSGVATYHYSEYEECWCFEGEDEVTSEDGSSILIGTDITIPFDYAYMGMSNLYVDVDSDDHNHFNVSITYALEKEKEDSLSEESKTKLREELNALETVLTEIIDEKINDQWKEDYSSVYYSNIFDIQQLMLDTEKIDPLRGILISIDHISIYGYNSEYRSILLPL